MAISETRRCLVEVCLHRVPASRRRSAVK